MALGSTEVVIATLPTMFKDNCLLTDAWVGLVESVTVTLTVKLPVAPGVPVMVPAVGSMVNGDGSPVADQVSGALPPVAAIGPLLYAAPSTPPGSEVVVIARAGAMVSDNCLVAVWCVGRVASVTVTLT